MRVHVMGPNLFNSGHDETFHVHREGCADVKRSPVYRGSDHKSDRENAIDFPSLVAVAEYVYDFEEDAASLIHDFHVFDCARDLPER